MKHVVIGLGTLLMVVTLASGQSYKTEDSVEHPFPQGGKVEMRLDSASYTVRAGFSDRIVIRWQAKKPSDLDGIKVRIDVSGSIADIRTDGPARRANFVIELPRRTDIFLRMRAGEIKIGGIEGDKEVSMTAGDLEIEADPRDYEKAHASVTFGDLQSTAFDISKSGIGRSFDWRGGGQYTLRATLFAGDLNIRRSAGTL